MATINGTNSANSLVGTSTSDTINGRGGNDTIRGAGGPDTITGGTGSDTFVYQAVSDSTLTSWDVITDFVRGSDRINLAALLGATDLIWGGTTPTANGIWYTRNGTTVSLFIDTNGASATPEMRIDLQNISAGTTLNASDFIGVAAPVNTAAPVITSPTAYTVAENSTAVGTVTATDSDSPTLTYSLVAGGDAGLFTINATTGALSFINAPDFEAPGDAGADNVYNLTVQVSDGALTTTQAIAVTVTDVANESLTGTAAAETLIGTAADDVITGNGGADNLTGNGGADRFVYAAAADSVPNANWATPPDGSVTRTWDVITDFVQGADKIDVSAFLGATDLAWGNTTPNDNTVWYAKSGSSTFIYVDAGGGAPPELMIELQNSASLVPVASDFIGVVGGFSGSNTAPVITSPTAYTVAENSTAVGTVTATDADSPTLTYSLVAGGDAAFFTVNATTGALSFVNAPNFEAPADAGANNVFNLAVQVSDGNLSTTQAIAVTVTDVANEGIVGTGGNDTMNGTAADDLINISAGGNDTVNAGSGNDTIAAGAAFNSADRIDGGTEADDTVEIDTLVLDGNYAAGVTLAATTLLNVEAITLAAGNSYSLTTHDATVVGSTLSIDGSGLGAASTLTVNASAETEAGAAYVITGGAGNDILTGGAGADSFDISFGGNDVANGGGGRDSFFAGGALTAVDQINGGAGTDFVYLSGNYGSGLTLGANTLVNVEVLVAQAGNNYNLTMNNAMLTGTQQFSVDGFSLGAGNSLTANVSAETDAGTSYMLAGGGGNDRLIAGAGNDLLIGNGGNDTLTGGIGNDVFDYNAITDRGTAGDVIADFSRSGANGVDVLNLHDLLLTFTGFNGNNAFSGGYLQFDTSSGTGTAVRVDSNGGANSYVTLATLAGTLLQQGDTANYVL